MILTTLNILINLNLELGTKIQTHFVMQRDPFRSKKPFIEFLCCLEICLIALRVSWSLK